MDQWDWEKVIAPRDRNVDYLKATVQNIVSAMVDTQTTLQSVFPQLTVLPQVNKNVTFVTSQELEDAFPDLTPKERGRRLGKGSPHHLPHADRRRPEIRQAPRRPGPRL